MMPEQNPDSQRRWNLDPMALIFFIIIIGAVLTHIVPAGEFDRQTIDGVTRIVPDSYHLVDAKPASVMDVFVSVPRGLVEASQYLFIVFIAGGLFHLIQITGAMKNGIGGLVNAVGLKRRNYIVILTTMVFGFFGAAVGFENNIALVPVGVVVARAIGCSNIIGAGMAVGGIGVGFALSPINPYTVGVAQKVTELPLFSGGLLRLTLLLTALSLLCGFILSKIKKESQELAEDADSSDIALSEYKFTAAHFLTLALFVAGLGYMLFGIFRYGWYINEIAGVFLMMAVFIGIANGMGANRIVKTLMDGASSVTPGALVIGVAAAIKVILDDGKVTDTIIYELSGLLEGNPPVLTAVLMSGVQGIINIFIPGGSGQALVTMPVMAPLGDLLGVTRQVTVLAFQIGDGITNLIVPTSGGTLAMLAIARISYAEWIKFIIVYVIGIYILAWTFLAFAVLTGYS